LFAGTFWKIKSGENWAVIGPNGAGKTSLMGALAGEIPVVGGRITRADGLQGAGKIGYLSFERHRDVIAAEEARDESRFFSGRFDNGLTMRKLLAGTGRFGGFISVGKKRLIKQLGIHGFMDRRLRNLSTGEIRMVLIARELLKKPRLLILDEPFGGLDQSADRRLVGIIDELMRQRVQVILVTHHLEKIGPLITHVLAVRNGQVFFQGPRSEGLDPERIRQLYALPSGTDNPVPPENARSKPNRQTAVDDVWIEMKNVCIRFSNRSVFENLNWKVRRNENWMISGPNGAGKTTLLRLVTADHPQAYANEIYLFGRRRGSGESIWDIKNRIGMISSEFQIRYRKPIPVFDVVLSGFFDSVGLYRYATTGQKEIARQWMQTLKIVGKSERLFHTLSQGEQRMVLLARAMIKSPSLLVLDEPCQGLDPPARNRLLRLIDWIGGRTGTQLLYVTHHPDEVLPCITHELRFERTSEKGYRVIQEPIGRR
jgi:molybdate transport system ATP-binding protein